MESLCSNAYGTLLRRPSSQRLIERFYPEPLRISGQMVGAILVMVAGAVMLLPLDMM